MRKEKVYGGGICLNVNTSDDSSLAEKLFIGHEEPRKLFWETYYHYKEKQYITVNNIQVITYYGIDGIGKTSLLNVYCNRKLSTFEI